MYTAKILSVTKEAADVLPILVVTVQYFKDGVEMNLPDLKPIRTSQYDSINDFIAQQINTFEKQDAINSLAANPPVGDVAFSKQADPTPRDIYFNNVSILRNLKADLDSGVTPAQQDYTNQQTVVNKLYQASYYGL